MPKKFIKNNKGFLCNHCGAEVPLHKSSSRDHCNSCLWSLHVDINPGDRLNECKGLMKPIGTDQRNGKFRIAYECTKCSKRHFCIKADDDDFDEIVRVNKMVYGDIS